MPSEKQKGFGNIRDLPRVQVRIVRYGALFLGMISGIWFILFQDGAPLGVRIGTKLLPGLMAAVYLVSYGVSSRNWAVLAGLIFSTLGDLLMVFPNPDILPLGILVNLIGIGFYIAYFMGLNRKSGWLLSLPGLGLIGVLYLGLYKDLGNFKIPVAIYCLVSAAFLWRSLVAGRFMATTLGWLLFLSAFFVVLSDSLLSLILFQGLGSNPIYYQIVMTFWWSGLFGLSIFSSRESSVKTISGT